MLEDGRSCSTVVEHTEVLGSNSTGWWAFFLFHLFLLPFISEMSLIRSLKEVHLQVCAVKAIKMNA